jgi:hypothetical protein
MAGYFGLEILDAEHVQFGDGMVLQVNGEASR